MYPFRGGFRHSLLKALKVLRCWALLFFLCTGVNGCRKVAVDFKLEALTAFAKLGGKLVGNGSTWVQRGGGFNLLSHCRRWLAFYIATTVINIGYLPYLPPVTTFLSCRRSTRPANAVAVSVRRVTFTPHPLTVFRGSQMRIPRPLTVTMDGIAGKCQFLSSQRD